MKGDVVLPVGGRVGELSRRAPFGASRATFGASRGRFTARPEEFAEWVRPHWAVMHNLAARLGGEPDRDDIVQEALTAAWRKFAQFDPARGTPRAWLLAIVADQAGKARRRVRRTEPLADVTGVPDVLPDLDLRRAVAELPHRQRLAVELHYYLQLPVSEAAQVMGCAEGTVKSTLSAARAALRARLGEDRP